MTAPKRNSRNIIYKEQIINLLLPLLDTSAYGLNQSKKFEKEYQKRLGFQQITEWKKYRASVDLLVDTEYAIRSAFEYQLGNLNNKRKDIGELYIRLYGILNAVYLQMGAFETIANLLNFSMRGQVSQQFHSLGIYKLRGMAASHTTDYKNDPDRLRQHPEIGKKTSFRIIQCELEETGKHIRVQDENDISVIFNLVESLTEYEKMATELLIKLIRHTIKTRYPSREHRTQIESTLRERLPFLLDYTTIDKNKVYLDRQKKKRDKLLRAIDFDTDEMR